MTPTDLLLVEDNPDDLDLALRALRKADIRRHVEVARDGAEALAFLFGDGDAAPCLPRVILLDLKLPKVDGLEVLRRIKGDARTRSIPVVVLTSSKEQRDIVESYQLGVNSYIVKPVSFERFMAVVSELGLYWLTHNESPHATD